MSAQDHYIVLVPQDELLGEEKSYRAYYESTPAGGGISETDLGIVESFRATTQVMHRSPGMRNIARKTSHPLRWRFSTTANPGHDRQRQFETRWQALRDLVAKVAGVGTIEAERLAREAVVRQARVGS